MAGAADLYGNFGGVPAQTPVRGSGGEPLQVRANPEEFGAQIEQGVQKVGETAEDQSVKYANMQMETAQNNAEVAFIKDSGDLKNKYMQYEGSQAEKMRPQYEVELQAIQQKYAQNLPLIAQHGYDMNTTKAFRYATTDYAGYAAQQSKQANMYSGAAQVDIGKMMASDPSVAISDSRFGEQALAPIVYGHGVQMDMDHPGLKTDSETGRVGFDENTPQGQSAKAQFQNNLNQSLGMAWENRFKTLSSTIGPIATYDKFQQDKDGIPADSAIRIDASLQPQVMNAHANNVTNSVMADAAQQHQQILLNPQKSDISDVIHQQESGGKPHDYQIQPGTFAQYAKSGESFENPADQDAVYHRIIADLKQTYPNDPARQAVGYFSGKGNVAPEGSPVPWLQDKQDANGKTVSSYVSDINNRMGTSPSKPYATNSNGTPLTIADYASTHRQYLYQKGDEYAETTMPGSLQFRNIVRERVTQQINASIEDQRTQYNQNNHNIDRAYNGEFTQGKKPTSWAQLEAIPGMQDAINFSNERTPEFIRSLDARLTARSGGEHEDKTFGDGFMDGMKGIHPTDGSAPTITTSNQLYDMYYANKITNAGRERLQKELDGKNTPEGDAEGIMKKQFLNNAHAEITGTNEGLGIKDHKGEELYLRFLAQALPAYDKGRADGKGAAQLLNPDSPDYIGKSIPTFKRPAAVWANDMLTDNAQGAVGGRDLNAIIKDVQSGKLTSAAGKQEALQAGLIRSDEGPQVPKPE